MNRSHDTVFRLLPLLLAAIVLLTAGARAQTDLENVIKQQSSQTVAGYIQPLVDMFGANMNAGFYHSAYIPVSGFSIGFDIIAMGSVVQDAQKKYLANTPAGFNPGDFETATIFGSKGTTVAHKTITGLEFKGSDGIINTSMFPLAVPQLRVGSLYGTEAVLRFAIIPSMNDGSIPVTKLWGTGANHSLSQYIPGSPVDIAAGVYYDSFTMGDIINYKGIAANLHASKSIKILILYGGVAWESSKMNLTYNSSDTSVREEVNLDLTGSNKFRFTMGVGVSLGILKIFADANFGSVTHYSGGIGFGR
jgi:hypothetical protein